MTLAEEIAFEKKAERWFRGQRELPNGRNFLWNSFRFKSKEDLENYRKNFDLVFPHAPGAGI